MKGTNKEYDPKKSLVFTGKELLKLFVKASDDAVLFLKVCTDLQFHKMVTIEF